MRDILSRIIAVVSGVFLLFSPALAQQVQPGEQKTVLRVATYPVNPPWEFVDQQGNFYGFEVDIINEAARRMGVDASFRGFDFPVLFMLTAGDYADLAISTIAITEERLESHGFTQPYYKRTLGVVVGPGSGISRIGEGGVQRIGAGSGTYAEDWIEENTDKINYAVYKGYDSMQDLLTDLQAGEIDLVIEDIVPLRYALRHFTGLRIAEAIEMEDLFAIMGPKDSPYLAVIDRHISDMKRDGTMAGLYRKWFGVEPETTSVTLMPTSRPVGGGQSDRSDQNAEGAGAAVTRSF